jgi:hypothetical protein
MDVLLSPDDTKPELLQSTQCQPPTPFGPLIRTCRKHAERPGKLKMYHNRLVPSTPFPSLVLILHPQRTKWMYHLSILV